MKYTLILLFACLNAFGAGSSRDFCSVIQGSKQSAVNFGGGNLVNVDQLETKNLNVGSDVWQLGLAAQIQVWDGATKYTTLQFTGGGVNGDAAEIGFFDSNFSDFNPAFLVGPGVTGTIHTGDMIFGSLEGSARYLRFDATGGLSLLNGSTLTAGNYHIEPKENDAGNSSTTQTIDWSTASSQLSTLTGNVTYTFSNPQAGGSYVLRIATGAGGFTATWPASVKWPGGTAPTITTAAGKVDLIRFYYDGTNYYGSFSQNY